MNNYTNTLDKRLRIIQKHISNGYYHVPNTSGEVLRIDNINRGGLIYVVYINLPVTLNIQYDIINHLTPLFEICNIESPRFYIKTSRILWTT